MLNNYIFITIEGYTFAPDSDFVESEIDNAQVIGFSQGENPEEAFKILIKDNDYLLKMKFNELICFKLDENFKNEKKCFYISDLNKK